MFIKVESGSKDVSYINPSYLIDVNAFEGGGEKGLVYIYMVGDHVLHLRFDNFADAKSYAQDLINHLN